MATKRPTIYDVARLAKVSPATVSRVLNQPKKV
jgi:LacI family transcriptional regulator